MGAIEHPPIISLAPWGIPDYVFYAWIVMGILLIASFILGMTESMTELQRRITLAFWTIAPAVYLFLEYRVFWDRLAPDHLEALRHFQDLTRNVWLGCVAVLAAIYKIKFGEP